MRFNSEAYSKAFPRQKVAEKVETVAEGFTPTTDKLKAMPEEVVGVEIVENTDGDGSLSESDIE